MGLISKTTTKWWERRLSQAMAIECVTDWSFGMHHQLDPGDWGALSLPSLPLHRWQRLIFLELLKMAAIDWRGIILSQGCMVSDQYSYLPICDPSKAALVCNGIIAIIFPWSPKFKGGNANHLKSYFKRWYQVAKIRHTRCWYLDGLTRIPEDTTPLQAYCVDSVAYAVSNVDVDFSFGNLDWFWAFITWVWWGFKTFFFSFKKNLIMLRTNIQKITQMPWCCCSTIKVVVEVIIWTLNCFLGCVKDPQSKYSALI